MEKLRTIRLYGKLGTKYGRVHKLFVASPAEAIRALCIQLPGFFEDLRDSDQHGISYAVLVNKTSITEEQLADPPGDGDIRIAPIIQGSKRGGLFQVVLGVVLIAASFIVPASWGATFSVFGAAANTTIFMLGTSMLLGGIAQMLAPQPKLDMDAGETSPNTSFSGPVNTTANGTPVPIAIGLVMTGSAVISASIVSEVPANKQRWEFPDKGDKGDRGGGFLSTIGSKKSDQTVPPEERTSWKLGLTGFGDGGSGDGN